MLSDLNRELLQRDGTGCVRTIECILVTYSNNNDVRVCGACFPEEATVNIGITS